MSKQIYMLYGAPLSLGDTGGSFIYNILPVGKFRHRGYGEVEITPKLVRDIAKNFGKHPAYPVPVKLGHGEGAPSPGTVKTAEARPDGLYITFEVDAETASAIRSRKYRYMSAEFDATYTDRTGENVGGVITGAGLVNQPGHPDVAPFMLSDREKEDGRENERKGGAGMDELDDLKRTNAELTRELEWHKREKRETEVAALCDGWRKSGVPPFLVDSLKPLMLSDAGTVKLADGKEANVFDIVRKTLDDMPRVDMSGVNLSAGAYVPSPSAGSNDYAAGKRHADKINEGRRQL